MNATYCKRSPNFPKIPKFAKVWPMFFGYVHSFLSKMVKILFSKLKKLEYKNWAQICSKVKHKKLYLVNLRSDEPLTKSCLLLSLLPLPFSIKNNFICKIKYSFSSYTCAVELGLVLPICMWILIIFEFKL